MMDVIIVSKTHMSKATCVGGIFANGRLVRLLDCNGHNQDKDTDIEIGDVFTIEYRERTDNKPPHVEDILVQSMKLKFKFKTIDKMVSYLREKLNITIWEGSPNLLFDETLQWTDNGSGYISQDGVIPTHSVGFWIPDRDLSKNIFFGKVRYNYPQLTGWRSLPYVGFEDPIDVIPSGTLIRVSLARWWDRNGETENRCSLQLSNWYILNQG